MEKGRTLRHDDLTATPGGSVILVSVMSDRMCYEVRCICGVSDPGSDALRKRGGDFWPSIFEWSRSTKE